MKIVPCQTRSNRLKPEPDFLDQPSGRRLLASEAQLPRMGRMVAPAGAVGGAAASWYISSCMSVIDTVLETELLNLEAFGGHLTIAVSVDAYSGRLTHLRGAELVCALSGLAAAVLCTFALALLVARAISRRCSPLHEPAPTGARAIPPTHGTHVDQRFGELDLDTRNAQHAIAEKEMEVAALHSKLAHLEREARQAERLIERRQHALRELGAAAGPPVALPVGSPVAHGAAAQVLSPAVNGASPTTCASSASMSTCSPESALSYAAPTPGAHSGGRLDALLGGVAGHAAATPAFKPQPGAFADAAGSSGSDSEGDSPSLQRFACLLGMPFPADARARTH